MRSKEVEQAIEIVSNVKTGIMNFNELINDNKDIIDSVETLLAYIEELENARSPYFIPKVIIRLTIEKYKNKIQELYKKDLWKEPEYTILKFKYENYIEVLKELLGGE